MLFANLPQRSLLLFVWWPGIAIAAFGASAMAAFFLGNGLEILIAGSFAFALVARVASVAQTLAYTVGMVLAYVFFSSDMTAVGTPVESPLAYIFISVLSGALGLGLRITTSRQRALEVKLAEQREHEQKAVQDERRWIAEELHDSIAHQLSVISLHSQMLDDEEMRQRSQAAISDAARRALSDLRFVIKIAEEEPRRDTVSAGDLARAFDESAEEFRAAGHTTTVEGDPQDKRISRGAELILTKVVRESATNIIKYAGQGPVHMSLRICPSDIKMTIRSPYTDETPRVRSSTGTGINRMAERVYGVNGEFETGLVNGEWQVTVLLPL